MKKIKSSRERSEELVKLINEKTNYKAKVMSNWTAYCFASGHTIIIKKSFFDYIKLVYDAGDLLFYTDKKEKDFYKTEKEIIKDIEKLTNSEIYIEDMRQLRMCGD